MSDQSKNRIPDLLAMIEARDNLSVEIDKFMVELNLDAKGLKRIVKARAAAAAAKKTLDALMAGEMI